ncbi:MAG: ABC transporter permease, partial [Candidatus Hodarchaeota archaeon]
MMSLEKLGRLGNRIAVPIISILIAFLLGTLTLIILGFNPIEAYSQMVFGVLSPNTIADILYNATPLIFTGLSVAVAFRAGMFNIGADGQLYFGAFLSALVGFGLSFYFGIHLPFFIMIPLLIVVAAVGGALWSFVPAILKARGVHEVITTIMMNHIALGLMIFLVGDLTSPFIDKQYGGGNVSPQTPQIAPEGRLPTIFGRSFSSLHWGFIFSLIASIIVFIILWRTRLGYEARAVGHNPSAAKYGGISVPKNYIYIMLISGALAGLAGGFEVMGYWYRFLNRFSPGYGFDGISVALIGGNHPFGVIFGAILFGWLVTGGQILQGIGIPKDVANTLKGFIVFFVAIPLLTKMIIDYLKKTKQWDFIKSEVTKVTQRWQWHNLWYFVQDIGLIAIIAFCLLLYSELAYGILGTIISTILFISAVFGYFRLKKRNYPNSGIRHIILVTCIILGMIEFINLINLFGQDVVVFGLIILTGIFIFYQEWSVRGKHERVELNNEIVSAVKEIRDNNNPKRVIGVYLISLIYFFILIVLISLFGYF